LGVGHEANNLTLKKRLVTKPYNKPLECNEYLIETKTTTRTDQNHGLDIWHMECSDHVAAREDDDEEEDQK
jgi:hypothetical protein